MRPLRTAAWTNVALHGLGLALAAALMRPATPIFPVAERTAFLAEHPLGWQVSWGVWALCGLALVTFFAFLADHLPRPAGRLAFGLGVGAAAIDLACDTAQALVLPALAREGGTTLYLAVERGLAAGGLVPANGLYTLAVLVANVALRDRAPRHVLLLGWATVASGLGMVVAGLVNDPRLIEAVTGPVMVAYAAWCVTAARTLEP